MAGQARFEIVIRADGDEIRESVKTRKEVVEYAKNFLQGPGYRVEVFDRVTGKFLDTNEIKG